MENEMSGNQKLQTNSDVIKKLIGEVHPVGKSEVDRERLDNLEEMICVVEALLFQIKSASNACDRHEYSMKKIGERAKEYLNELGL